MPSSFDDPAAGYAAFAAIKVVGYGAFAALRIARLYGKPMRTGLSAGLARTLIGAGVGSVYGLGMGALVALTSGAATPLFFLGLVPMRLVEWWILVRWLYDRSGAERGKCRRVQIEGTIFSFILDVPAIVGLVTVGRLWIC